MPHGKIQDFTQLDSWTKSHELAKLIFECSKRLPKHDILRVQMERSALSITSNIAEGFGRQSIQDKRHFYIMARGSGYELKNQILLARDLGKIDGSQYIELSNLSADSTRLIHGLIRSLDKSRANS